VAVYPHPVKAVAGLLVALTGMSAWYGYHASRPQPLITNTSTEVFVPSLAEIATPLSSKHGEVLPTRGQPPSRSLVPYDYFRWSVQDGKAALEHALTHLKNPQRRDAALVALRGWASVSPSDAAKFAGALLTPDQDVLVYEAAQLFALSSPAEALAWALHDLPMELRQSAVQHVALGWLRTDAQAAMESIYARDTAGVSSSTAAKTALYEAVFHLAGRDLHAAAYQAIQFTTPAAQEAGISAIIDRWVDVDLSAAATWLKSVLQADTSLDLDEAVRTISLRYAETSPFLAQSWLSELRDDTQKESLLRVIHQRQAMAER
jgi:hypothetical protein